MTYRKSSLSLYGAIPGDACGMFTDERSLRLQGYVSLRSLPSVRYRRSVSRSVLDALDAYMHHLTLPALQLGL